MRVRWRGECADLRKVLNQGTHNPPPDDLWRWVFYFPFFIKHDTRKHNHEEGNQGAARRTPETGDESLGWAERDPPLCPRRIDRKSTRLNSSHANISYAVF